MEENEKIKAIKEYGKKMYDAILDGFSFLDNLYVDATNAADVLEKLMKIYLIGTKLPYLETVDLIDKEEEWRADLAVRKAKKKHPSVQFQYPSYTFTRTPYDEELFFFDIHIDLLEVFEDLMNGVAEYDAGYILSAVSDWGFSMEHWGEHLVNTFRPLEFIRTNQAITLSDEAMERINNGHEPEKPEKPETDDDILGFDADHGRIWIKREFLEKNFPHKKDS